MSDISNVSGFEDISVSSSITRILSREGCGLHVYEISQKSQNRENSFWARLPNVYGGYMTNNNKNLLKSNLH